MGDFALHKRKTSAYFPRNEHHFAFNRKISAYYTFAGYPVKAKTSYLYKNVLFRQNFRFSDSLITNLQIIKII
jgi:hypothetical protein